MRLLLLFIVCVCSLQAKTTMEADSADYDGKNIRMAGNVHIEHEFGTIDCLKGVVVMKEGSKMRFDPDRILLSGEVLVVLHDGSELRSDEADINCDTLEGVFTAEAPQKVEYVTRVEEAGKTVPVKTMSRAMRISMKKEEATSQYVVQDIQAEGAVNIEYQQEE